MVVQVVRCELVSIFILKKLLKFIRDVIAVASILESASREIRTAAAGSGRGDHRPDARSCAIGQGQVVRVGQDVLRRLDCILNPPKTPF